MAQDPPTLVDLFAGCGGLALGFHQAGFKTLLANELHIDPATTYVRNLLPENNYQMLLGPIEEQLSDKAIEMRSDQLNNVDCLAGGPPCQGLSLAGAGNSDDPRNMLFHEYLRVVKKIRPRSVLFENVPGFVNRYGLGLKSRLENELGKLEYEFDSGVVKASDFGVPQNRERFFLLGIRKDCVTDDVKLPKPTWTQKRVNNELTPSKVIDDLNSYQEWGGYGTGEIWGDSTYTKNAKSKFSKSMRKGTKHTNITWNTRIPKHTKKVANRMGRVLLGETREDWIGTPLETKKHTQRALRKDRYENITIVSIPDDFVHYDDGLPRTLSVRECARFQTFPDDFFFHGSRTTGAERRRTEVPQYTQVANAIPPRLAKAMANQVKSLLGIV